MWCIVAINVNMMRSSVQDGEGYFRYGIEHHVPSGRGLEIQNGAKLSS
jgi:hypothetical protein